MQRTLYAIVGAVLLLFLDLCVNLLAAAIQSRSFAEQFDSQSIWLIVWLIVAGLFLGWFFGGGVELPAQNGQIQPDYSETKEDSVTVTRLQHWFSRSDLRGKGIRLSNSWLIGSKMNIDTGDHPDDDKAR